MKAEYLIKMVRDDMEELNQLHLTWENSNGRDGLQCFNYEEVFLPKYNRTDKEIIEDALSKGIYIVDVDDYLSKEKK